MQAAEWRIGRGRNLAPAEKFGIMGIVNATPDSFYDGGDHDSPDAALAHALRLRDEGAEILDIGAESSRPGARPLEPGEEMHRLLPVLARLRQADAQAVVSIDTYHAVTAAAALEAGADIVNDISACAWDPALTDVLVQYRPGYVLMHSGGRPKTMQDAPRYGDVRREVRDFFERELNRLVRAGLPEECVVLDPGIGFGKSLEHNLALLAHPEDLLAFGRPLLAGISMKSLFGDLFGLPVDERAGVTATATALLAARGYAWHRVHDVKGAAQALVLARILS